MNSARATWIAGACLLSAACAPAPMPEPAPGATSGLEPSEPVANDLGPAIADAWVGAWKGPEGTSLVITREQAGYRLVITNLDGPRSFAAVGSQDAVQFERDGVTETIHAGDGPDTGMKWLADKKDCLVVKAGEGYCRD